MKNELSDREHQVLNFAVRGFTDDMIAHEIGIERGTVNSYWVRIRGKLGNFSRTELVARFVQKQADDLRDQEKLEADGEKAASKDALKAANLEIDRLREMLRRSQSAQRHQA